ncbi:MAG TPA: hypothetical protein VNI54_03420 [Thermoanaerobaculia bacterium]|nr:hypothetical protein [Thermoanaerobaculia bacterium]
MSRTFRYASVFTMIVLLAGVASAAPPMSGAIFTSDSTCTGTNVNIYNDKGDVYLDGGPAHPNAAGLPNGSYYVKVTDPDGTLLGSTPTAIVSISGGEFAECYRLVDILIKASDATPGYDDTGNPGGEYKAWVSTDPNFDQSASKTDNFKVKVENAPPLPGHLVVNKFYDANADGLWTAGEPAITGWQVTVQDAPHVWLDAVEFTPVDYVDEGGSFVVEESDAVQQNWNATTPKSVNATVNPGETTTVNFGNLCLGAGGGHTLGFWSNKNGAKLYNNAVAVAQNLVDASGASFDPTNHKQFNAWILSASATNMANMLSAQLAAMTQNVNNGNVWATSIVYAPGTGSANALGYATIGDLIDEANALLAANSYTVGSGPARAAQEAVKTAIDRANNNYNFVQASPCAFTF